MGDYVWGNMSIGYGGGITSGWIMSLVILTRTRLDGLDGNALVESSL